VNVDKMRRASERVIERVEHERVAAIYTRLLEENRNPRPLLTPEQSRRLREDMQRATAGVARALQRGLAEHPLWRPRRP